MLDWILGFAVSLMNSHPVFGTVLMVMSLLRVIFKPLMGIIDAYTKWSENKTDDKLFADFIASPFYTTFVYILDYFASIKIKK
jgi:hypothetical protein